jgi:hypothetical protein
VDIAEIEAALPLLPPEDQKRLTELVAAYKVAKMYEFTWTPRQQACIDTMDELRKTVAVPEVLYGGAMGGGKSYLICAFLTQQAEQHPGASFYLCRKELKALKMSTLEVLLREVSICSRPGWVHRKSDTKFVHSNGSTILYGALASDDDRDRIKSMNLTGACIDESSEVEKESALLLKSRCNRNHNGKPFLLHATNPEPCWLEEIVKHPKNGQVYVPALPTDNLFLPAGYIEQIRDTYSDTPELFEAYINGVWGVIGTTDSIFDATELRACIFADVDPDAEESWGVDVARFGDDSTVVYSSLGRRIAQWERKDTRQTADDIAALFDSCEKEPTSIRVDDIGVGGGVVDNLASAGLPVIGIGAAERAIDSDRFFNRRAEMYWHVRNLVRAKAIRVPESDPLMSELLATKYEIRSGKILVEPKARIKKRLGRSPDLADAFVLAHAPTRPPTKRARYHTSKPFGL